MVQPVPRPSPSSSPIAVSRPPPRAQPVLIVLKFAACTPAGKPNCPKLPGPLGPEAVSSPVLPGEDTSVYLFSILAQAMIRSLRPPETAASRADPVEPLLACPTLRG